MASDCALEHGRLGSAATHRRKTPSSFMGEGWDGGDSPYPSADSGQALSSLPQGERKPACRIYLVLGTKGLVEEVHREARSFCLVAHPKVVYV